MSSNLSSNPPSEPRTAERTLVLLGAVNGFIAVSLGAFGAHGLRDKLSAYSLDVYQTGAHYHLVHAVALLAVAALARWWATESGASSRPARFARTTGYLFTAGMAIFAGSLYLLAVTGIRWLGAITPLGGVCFLTGWVLLALAALSRDREGA